MLIGTLPYDVGWLVGWLVSKESIGTYIRSEILIKY